MSADVRGAPMVGTPQRRWWWWWQAPSGGAPPRAVEPVDGPVVPIGAVPTGVDAGPSEVHVDVHVDVAGAVEPAPAQGILLAGAVLATDSHTVVWDAMGGVALEHHPDPDLVADESVTAVRVARALGEARDAGLAGRSTHHEVSVYGPPRRELRVHGHPVLARPADPGSAVIGAVARIEDVSQQHRVEEMRRDFVANISHELRTPVGAIGVLAEMMVGEQSVPVLSRLAERMDVEAMRLARMVDELLSLARLEAGSDGQREFVVVREAVDAAIERVTPAVAGRSAISVVEVPPLDSPRRGAVVVGDPVQLISAIHNLLDNAVKYSEGGGPVTVRIDTETERGYVLLSVVDRGIGIPLGDRERIFERFYRVDQARTRDTGGTGLGLAIVRHVATNFGGHVQVHSIEGQGSTFTLRLPVGSPP